MDGLFWMAMDAMGISITTFAGQNYGANKLDRLKKGTYVGLAMSTIITAGLAALMFSLGPVLCQLFTNDPEVLSVSLDIMHFLVPGWFCYVCVNVFPSTLRGIGDAFVSMLLICFGTCVFRVVWVLAAVPVHPTLYTTLASYPLSWSITSIAFIIYYYRFSQLRKLDRMRKK
jgi:Na+-driven multidrug efflux pump